MARLQLVCDQKSIDEVRIVVLAPLILHYLSYHHRNDCLLKNVLRRSQSQLSSIWTDARFLVRVNITLYLHGAAFQTMSKFDRKQRDRASAPDFDSNSNTRRRFDCANH